MNAANPALTILLLIPIIGTLLIPLCPPRASRGIALVLGWAMLGVGAYLGLNFVPGHGMQFEQSVPWFRDPFPVTWHVGVDGMSVSLVLLTVIVTLTALYASKFTSTTRDTNEPRPQFYYSMVMLLTASILGTFVSLDLLQFFVFWELELAPMYFLIAIWGGPRRSYAAMKFLLYTFFGGIFMLAGLLYLYFQLGANGIGSTFDIMQLQTLAPALPRPIQAAAALGFLLAFTIKLPSFPFHTWLPDAHVEAPTPISMILAGLLLKMGSYGLVRIVLGFFPDVIADYGPWIIALGAFNVVWAAVACLVQTDMKRVIAFSSVSHMGFVLMGLGALSAAALNGAIFQMVAHGFISAALFFLVGVVYDRVHTRDIPEIGGGLAQQMPETFYFWLLAAMANLGLPALAGFVAEVTVFYGAYTSPVADAYPWARGWIIFAGLGVILSAGYMLWLVRRLFYGAENPRWGDHVADMMPHERFVGAVLGFFIIALGVYPLSLTHFYTDVSDNMAKQAAAKLPTASNTANPSM
jgi:proton-translocating NADH-quinone oxidoreductase chain M